MLSSLLRLATCWEALEKTKKPVILYGMGNAADRIFDRLEQRGIAVADVFASDGFVRGHSFRGMRVKSLQEIREIYRDPVIVTAFAVHDQPTMERFYRLDEEFELYAPDLPVAGEEYFDRDFVRANLSRMEEAYSLLADETSRQVFWDLAAYKLTGKLCYLRKTVFRREEVLDGLIQLDEREDYVDLGAYNGDTIEEFLTLTGGKFSSICAVEPDRRNFRKLEGRMEKLGLARMERVMLHNLAAWEDKAEIPFGGKGGRASSVAGAGAMIPADSVDNLLGRKPVSFLKMDVEGSEAKAILGAANAIRRHKPKLMIAAYHRSEDLFSLLLQIRRVQPGYRFYLRRFPYIPAWEIYLIGRYGEGQDG